MGHPVPPPRTRSGLAADALYALLRRAFDAIPDHRAGPPDIPLGDALLSAFAMFALTDPSRLAFDQRREDPSDNVRAVVGIRHVPCDTRMRESLAPAALGPCFRDIFRRAQRGSLLPGFVWRDGRYLVSLDGTNDFSSTAEGIHGPECLVQAVTGIPRPVPEPDHLALDRRTLARSHFGLFGVLLLVPQRSLQARRVAEQEVELGELRDPLDGLRLRGGCLLAEVDAADQDEQPSEVEVVRVLGLGGCFDLRRRRLTSGPPVRESEDSTRPGCHW